MDNQSHHKLYNIFMHRHKPALHCAVRQDWPVPKFIGPEMWMYSGTMSESEPLPGFDVQAAQQAGRMLSYYVFTSLARR
ncbi:hypothetical protein GOFOIKOB_5212 [Methylobacterium tardum]|uniref:Uncharacterized protein n=1 Tax=Methylobacterium tardum TaxID=374432 RepID=A0AA37TI30_9HYPH|nr:hypothetical protein [Methylobacterium tardum]URD38125.1 hypothetical protein M6G65_06535 [Methylobacterium tardum]GJE52144.1 hypothetical protein GOFOIKOB_5212 [Methylobacterium tardum]GLS71708.1 hypothetical protein GCM10007890_37210 [Methylobacterium tardum]